MKKGKRMLAICLACVLLVCAMALPASAKNNTDTNFTVRATSTSVRYANSETAQRLKEDDSSSYINYSTRVGGGAATGPYQFEAFIYGANTRNGSYVDCSSYTYDGYARSKCIVTRGSVGLVRQDVYEKFGSGSYGQIWGKMAPSGTSGYAKGCWSVDSLGSYPYYNYVL